jgi:bacterioferritin-associated ferredoxin
MLTNVAIIDLMLSDDAFKEYLRHPVLNVMDSLNAKSCKYETASQKRAFYYCDPLSSTLSLSQQESASMVVCICNAIREKDLKEAVRDGADTPCSAYARFGRRPKCGQCVPFARTIIAAERASA